MTLAKEEESLQDIFLRWLACIPKNARLVLVLDPLRILETPGEIVDSNGRSWRAFDYCENDLAFRSAIPGDLGDTGNRDLVHVTYPTLRKSDKINLTFIADMVERADQVKDFSLQGILTDTLPEIKWQPELVNQFSDMIVSHFAAFRSAFQVFRQHISAPVFNIHLMRSIMLKTLEPQLDIEEVLFNEASEDAVLRHYLRLIWMKEWNKTSLNLIRALAQENPRISMRDISHWTKHEPDVSALYVYLRLLIERYRKEDQVNQLRGLQLLTFEPMELESDLNTVREMLRRDNETLIKMVSLAERLLSHDDIEKILSLIISATDSEVAMALSSEVYPAISFGLSLKLMDALGTKSTPLKQIKPEILQSANLRLGKGNSCYTDLANHAIEILKELAYIESTLSKSFREAEDLEHLISWYINSHIYRLEFALAKVRDEIKKIPNEKRRQSLGEYADQVWQRISNRLDEADQSLARLLERDFQSYTKYPRLSTRIVNNYFFSEYKDIARRPKLWLLVFDGMRWDSWEEAVKPTLLKEFEIKNERPYVSLLPSITEIARVGILSGRLPNQWMDDYGKVTTDHRVLSGRLFNIPEKERPNKIRIIANVEGDMGQRRLDDLDNRTYPFNILIYNISDDRIHKSRNSITELNRDIEATMRNSVIPDLLNRVASQDLVVVTSDHGFFELHSKFGKTVAVLQSTPVFKDEDPRNPVNYRYLKGLSHPDGLKVAWGANGVYSVAKGKVWFRREGGKQERYAHGGVSLAEMVVPGAVLQRIVEPAISFEFLSVPKRIEAKEDETRTVQLSIKNNGNREGVFNLIMEADNNITEEFQQTLIPNQKTEIFFAFTPTIKRSVKTSKISCRLRYKNLSGIEQILPVRTIQVKVEERTDKVEVDTSALDKLDRI